MAGLVLTPELLLRPPPRPVTRPAWPVEVSRLPVLVSSSSSTSTGVRLLNAFSPQCVSLVPSSSTTTTDPSTGAAPLPCDQVTAQNSDRLLFLAVMALALFGFLGAFLVGLRLWAG